MSIASIPAVTAALDQPTAMLSTANPASPDYVPPPPPQPGPPPAKLPDINWVSADAATPAGTDSTDSATSQRLAAARSTLLTLQPASTEQAATGPQPLRQSGPIQPTLSLTL